MIQRMSDQHKISFLDSEKSSKNTVKVEAVQEKTLNQISEEQKAKKLNSHDNGMMTSQHISSATTGGISDQGGPSKYVKSESSNTIWDSGKNAEVSKELDNKTKTIQEKAQISSNKRDAEQNRMDSLAETLKSTIQEKASSVSPAGILSGTNYKISENNMSIFDKKDFERVQDKTDGEKVSDDIKNKKSQVDNSWRGGGKVVSSKDVTKKLFDGLFTKSE